MLGGEGAQQDVRHRSEHLEPPSTSDPWKALPEPPVDGSPTYYDRPVLKEPVWIWSVPVYFFCGGAAGAAAVLGEAARLLDREDLESLSYRCRVVAAAGTSAGAGLLIIDLGRPERFLNMLRVFRPTSAISVGSWVLALSGALTAASAGLTAGARRTRKLERISGFIADAAAAGSAVLGLPLAGYTAVLLADTAVPLWQQTRRVLPPLFVSSAAASAASVLKLFPYDSGAAPVLQRFGIMGGAAEIIFAYLTEKQAKQVDPVGRPLEGGPGGSLWKASKLFGLATVGLAFAERGRRPLQIASALCGVAGGLALRLAVFHAGKQSARDPRATFHLQRS